ncbi:MAG: S-adenosylmethionine decarboxylase [Planctomycetota bacterium]
MVGTEWLVDAFGCPASVLTDLRAMQGVCEEIIRDLDLKVLGSPHWHQFPSPSGVTGLYLLSESHLSVHTYPEYETATFNLYCCRERAAWRWEEGLTELLLATEVRTISFPRGIPSLADRKASPGSGAVQRGDGV